MLRWTSSCQGRSYLPAIRRLSDSYKKWRLVTGCRKPAITCVLTGPITASAGVSATVSFRGCREVRPRGQQPTATQQFGPPLSDGAPYVRSPGPTCPSDRARLLARTDQTPGRSRHELQRELGPSRAASSGRELEGSRRQWRRSARRTTGSALGLRTSPRNPGSFWRTPLMLSRRRKDACAQQWSIQHVVQQLSLRLA